VRALGAVSRGEAALAGSAELLAEPELRTWFLTAEDLAPILNRLETVRPEVIKIVKDTIGL
jgi:hypothetical protein